MVVKGAEGHSTGHRHPGDLIAIVTQQPIA